MDDTTEPRHQPGENARELEVVALMRKAMDPNDPYVGEDLDGADPTEEEATDDQIAADD